jgi:hypothetical protein
MPVDYDKDIIKHYVRKNGLVIPFKKIMNHAERHYGGKERAERFKYLTFCAKNAIDVFLFEKEKLLYRDGVSKRLVNVYFCEENLEDFTTIQKLIGSAKQGFYGNFNELMLSKFPNKKNKGEFDEEESPAERNKLRVKEIQISLYQSFPFDAINLDIYGNYFPENDSRYSEQCKILSKILELQKNKIEDYSIDKFILFLTVYTPIKEKQINKEVHKIFLHDLNANFSYNSFKSNFENKYKSSNINNLLYHLFFSLSFFKLVLLKESYRNGWEVNLLDLYCYDRKFSKSSEQYKMSNYVLEFNRNERLDVIKDFGSLVPLVIENNYLNELEKFINNFPKDVPQEEEISIDIKKDLENVVNFRNEFLRSIEN